MKAFLGLLVTLLVIDLVVIASGIGIGLLLRWVLPSVDLGMGILIGIVSIGLSIHLLQRILSLGEVLGVPEGDDGGLGAADHRLPAKLFPIGTQAEAQVKRLDVRSYLFRLPP